MGKEKYFKRTGHYNLICQWVFKGRECGYVESETSCDHTKERCKELGNYDPLKQRPNIFDVKNHKKKREG